MSSRRTNRDPALTLKSMPPRAVRSFLDRERLRLERFERGGARVAALFAPAGFGKTAQLVQWRREALARGAVVLWFSVDSRDEPLRLVQGLSECTRAACGKRGFDDSFLDWISRCTDPREAIIGWLAEVADVSVDVLLLLDDVESMPAAARMQVLVPLLGNAPPNLGIALAARGSTALLASDVLSSLAVARVTAADLRFRLDETVAVLSAALGARCSADAAVRLHEITEGWPLGVQLAIGALARGGDLESLVAAVSSDIQRFFVDAVIDRQSTPAVQLLVRSARFDLLHPQLCAEVLADATAAGELMRLQEETPLLLRTEGESWMRLHPLAREVLQERLARLPPGELQALSRKASAWYADRELFEEAADQAFLAGDMREALSLVERSTMHMTVQGRSTAVLSWYDRLSPGALCERPVFWIPAAWALAMSDRHAEVAPLLEMIRSQPGLDQGTEFEAALIGTTAASFADRFDLAQRSLEPWSEPLPRTRPDLVPVYVDALAHQATLRGQPDQARLMLARIGRLDRAQAYSPVSYGFVAFGIGLAWLWEGRATLAEEVLQSALVMAEEDLGRHHPMACMLAALCAQACSEIGRDDEATALLAGRTDTLERFGLPDALMAAYRTLARIEERAGRQNRSLALLEALRAIGRSREMIRLQVLAQAEIVRLHARNGRAVMACSTSVELDALVDERRVPMPDGFMRWLNLRARLARAQALLAHEGGSALPRAPLLHLQNSAESAVDLAAALKRTGDLVEARLLLADALRRSGSVDAGSMQQEAISLGLGEGMLQLLRDYGVSGESPGAASTDDDGVVARRPGVRGANLLTVKEREVLSLLERKLSNKEIAAALSVSEETIKWHVKNLFGKLDAANRRHAVARARLLGLIDA